MDRLPGDLWALFSKEIQRFAQQDAGSFCFHPLHPLRPGLACLRKLLIQLPNLACRAGCAVIYMENPGLEISLEAVYELAAPTTPGMKVCKVCKHCRGARVA